MKILSRPDKVIADANCILSAVCGHAALRIFTETHLRVVATEFNLQEVKRYLPKMSRKYRISEAVLLAQLELIRRGLEIREKPFYESQLTKAEQMIGDRDPGDIDLVALALQTGLPIWSNDKDITSLPLQTANTAELLRMFGL